MKATTNSMQLINNANKELPKPTAQLLNIKVKPIRVNNTMCPPVMFANKRIIKEVPRFAVCNPVLVRKIGNLSSTAILILTAQEGLLFEQGDGMPSWADRSYFEENYEIIPTSGINLAFTIL